MQNLIRKLIVAILISLAPFHAARAVDIKGDIMTQPVAVGEFTLTDQNGKTFDTTALSNGWSLVYFGFTNCGHICPVHMLQISKFYRELEARPTDDKNLPRVIFVSVDPARDSVEKVKSYVNGFHPDFVGLTGDEKEIARLENFLQTQHKANLSRNGSYQVDHSSLLYLINPQREFVASFYPPFYIDNLVKDYLAVLGSQPGHSSTQPLAALNVIQ